MIEKKILSELIIAIRHTLDAIDVRATDPRRFEAKHEAKRILMDISNKINRDKDQIVIVRETKNKKP